MSARDTQLELQLASIIRRATPIQPFGPNSRAVHDGGGTVMLTPRESEQAARAVLSSDWLAAHDARIREDALKPVRALADKWEASAKATWSLLEAGAGAGSAALREAAENRDRAAAVRSVIDSPAPADKGGES